MKTNRYLLGLALLVVGTMPSFSQVSNDNEDEVYKIDARLGSDFVSGQVLVKFKDKSPVTVSKARGMFRSVDNSAVNAVLKEFGVETMDKLLPNEQPLKTRRKARAYNGETIEEKDLSQLYIVKTKSLRRDSTMMLVDKLKAIKEIEFAEPNYKYYILGRPTVAMSEMPMPQITPNTIGTTRDASNVICASPGNNPLFNEQWGIKTLNIDALWNKPIINSKRPVIAILDTGVDIEHPDLKDNIWTNPKEGEGETAFDDDGNGFVDDIHGWNFVGRNSYPEDKVMHGTHVAGLAAASNNAIGIVGANPLALIMPVKVLNDEGQGNTATLVEGINYAVENGADVINMSIGGPQALALKLALEKAYMTAALVAAAGNEGKNIYAVWGCDGEWACYPAAYSVVLGVQATGPDGNLTNYTNFDPDGPMFSKDGVDGRNYELRAPGGVCPVSPIISTVPNGKYAYMCGTSMASPLVAGAISALKMVKEYVSNDVMNGDLMHLNCDFAKIVSDDTPRYPYLDFCAMDYDDSQDGGNGDGLIDVGETVRLYPTLVSSWTTARNIKLHLDVDEPYREKIKVTQNDAALGWSLSAYGRAKSENPLIIKVDNKMADETTVKLFLKMSADGVPEPYIYDFPITIHSTTKVGGVLTRDTTFTADKNYIITSNLAVPEGVTLTVEPGTKLRFKEGIGLSNSGTITIKGTPEKPIYLTNLEGDNNWEMIIGEGILEYCEIEHCKIKSPMYNIGLRNCIVSNSNIQLYSYTFGICEKCNFVDNIYAHFYQPSPGNSNNFVNNTLDYTKPRWENVKSWNYFNCLIYDNMGKLSPNQFLFNNDNNMPCIIKSEDPPYIGTSSEKKANTYIYDIDYNNGFAQVDLSNMRKEPVKEAHGIVWKVLVNGKDAQDEYDEIAPLGVGQHKFEVYFNRPMNKAKTPNVAFGLRSPYTQHAVNENGSWNEEGTIYTVYCTMDAKTQSDGINRIYVDGAEDNEYFECPYENLRFNFPLQSAGAMATGFMATPRLGRVDLKWNNDGNDFSDAMGFNVYRFNPDVKKTIPAHYDENNHWVKETEVVDTIRINDAVLGIETNDFTDYDVIPGEAYYYYYKVLSTDLQEYDVSNVVAATPLTATLGDANGSGDVNVMDVVTTVNYVVGMDPKPFIFEAADVNKDLDIDVLDVVGIVNLALNQSSARAMTRDEAAQAVYTIEDGVLYVETPITLAGLQVQFAAKAGTDIKAAEGLNGFEQASAWLTDEDYMLMAYSFGSKNLQPGKHALLHIGDAEMTDIRLGDLNGNLVKAVSGSGTTAIDKVSLTKTLNKAGVYNLNGQKVAGSADSWKLQHGVYIINGQKVVK